MVPYPLHLAHVDGAKYLVYLVHGEHLGEVASNLWGFEQFRGVLYYLLFKNEEPVKGAYAAENAGQAPWGNAIVSEAAGKQVQFVQCYRTEVYAVVCIEVE